jgi:two-component system NtrC family sensor kinase
MFALVYGSLVLFLGLGLYHAIVRPVRRLRQTTRAVQRGELSAEVAVHSGDEVGALAQDFVHMVDDLRASREEVQCKSRQLELLNEQLESEVDRKTRHLADTVEDLRRAQRELVHAAKMASVGTLAGGIAHEFNNVIGGIRGCASEALTDERDGERREPLEVILRAADRGTQVTRQLLRFSREPVGEKRPLDLETVLVEVLDLARMAARRGGVELEREIEGPLPLLADGGALHQVFLNLTTNAVQAMPEGGRLRVEAVREGEEVVCRVIDEGVGIPPEHLDRVFEPFFTTKGAAEDAVSRGTGLGLSVSYSIVEGHGGRIEVDSREGQGTCFTVRLPRLREEEA